MAQQKRVCGPIGGADEPQVSSDPRLSRRALLEVAAAATAVGVSRAVVAEEASASAAVGPNDRIRVAIMGVNGRGAALARGFAADPRAEVVADGQIARIRYVLPRHKAANWVGPSRSRKSTRPGANGVVDLSPFEFLDRLADLVPPPRKHRHRYHGVFAPNHKLRRAVTSLAIGNVGKRQEAVTGGHAAGGRATGGCCDANPNQKPRSHDTSRIAWAKLMARVGEEFPLACATCGGDIRLITFITDPGPIRKILTHLGEPLEPPPILPARGPPIDWGELAQVHDDRAIFQGRIDELPAIDIHSL